MPDPLEQMLLEDARDWCDVALRALERDDVGAAVNATHRVLGFATEARELLIADLVDEDVAQAERWAYAPKIRLRPKRKDVVS